MQQVKAENEENVSNGKQKIYSGGSDLQGSGHSNFVVKEGIVKFSQALWDKICSFFTKKTIDVATNNTVQNTSNVKSVTNITLEENEARHKQVVDEAVKYIEANFDNSPLTQHFKTPEDKQLFLQCLKEVVYDKEKTGAGHAEKGIIHIETNNKNVNSLAEMTKLLIHEANHAFLERKSMQNNTLNFPTKAEELECESLALTTMAYLVKLYPEKMKDYEIYGKPISSYTNMEATKKDGGVVNWLNGYQQLADDLSGNITIQHNAQRNPNSPKVEIKSGDIITVQGEPPKIIGTTCFMEGVDNTALGQVIMHNKDFSTPKIVIDGRFAFDNVPPTNEELKQAIDDNYNEKDFVKVPFMIQRKNAQTGALETVYTGHVYRHE